MQIFKKDTYTRLDIHNANIVKELLDSEVWKNVIEPYFNEYERNLMNGMIWKGDTDNIDKIGMGCVYNSGKIEMIRDFKRKLQIIIERGERARAELKTEV